MAGIRKFLRHFQQLVSSFRANESGQFALIIGVAALPLIGGAGSAVDYVHLEHSRKQLQAATDAAALAVQGDTTRYSTAAAKQSAAEATAKAYINGNGSPHLGTWGIPTVQQTADGLQTTIQVSAQVETAFMQLLGVRQIPYAVTSIAAADTVMPTCILALGTSGVSVDLSGSASLSAPDCLVRANSTAANSLRKQGAASAVSGLFCTAGGTQGTFTPLRRNCPQAADPFASVPFPSTSSSCSSAGGNYGGGYQTLNPGVYCNGMRLQGTAKVTLNPGVYVIRDSALTVSSNAMLTGTGVVIILQGSASFSFEAGSDVNLKGPTTGDYAGLVIAQDGASTTTSGVSRVHGGGTVNLEGSIYLPKQTLTVSGGGELNVTSKQTAIIAERFALTGHGAATLKLNMGADFTAAGYVGSPLASPDKLRIIR